MKERELQSLVEALAGRLGWLSYHTRDSRRSAPGFPDLVLTRGGRLIFAELKSAKGRITPEQRVWLDALERTRAEVHEWRPVDWPDRIMGALR